MPDNITQAFAARISGGMLDADGVTAATNPELDADTTVRTIGGTNGLADGQYTLEARSVDIYAVQTHSATPPASFVAPLGRRLPAGVEVTFNVDGNLKWIHYVAAEAGKLRPHCVSEGA